MNLTFLFFSQKVAYSCSAEGTIMVWDVSTLQVSFESLDSCFLLRFNHHHAIHWYITLKCHQIVF